MTAIRRNWPVVMLGIVWLMVVFASSMAVSSLWGPAAQVLFILPVFVLSLIGGTWVGRHWS